ncbi:MAG: nickel-responsive transcriptional regulator NikR [Sphingobacteriales bacterium]|nr:nickel-responsive transcriptional regulator NikR [Sphingobacteriales bacterium]
MKRFGVSLEESTLNELDQLVSDRKFPNRSQAVRHLIKGAAVSEKISKNSTVAGALVIVYDHHKHDLSNKLTSVQHDYHHIILSTQHIHLSRELCLETIAMRGKAQKLQEIADTIIGIKGIKHGKLVIAAV